MSASPRPRIGITYTYRSDEAGRSNGNVSQYEVAVRAAGGEPMLLANDAARAGAYLNELDGLVLSGGTDVSAARYGEARHPKTQDPNDARDELEIRLAHGARERGLPTLAVCRGLQLVNVAFGGTLVQHLDAQSGDAARLEHHQVNAGGHERYECLPEHEVRVESGSALARLLGTERFATNSMHHQAARKVAPGLRAVAWTPDGVIEALDAAFAHPFFYAVQWHPEELHGDPISAALFGGLVEATRRAARAAART